MLITFILPPGGGAPLAGGVRVIAGYAKWLQARGHVVRLVAPGRRPHSLRQLVRTVIKTGHLPERPRSLGHLREDQLDIRILDRPPPLRAEDVPAGDIVIATWWETAEWVAQLPPCKGAKTYLVQGHEIFPHVPRQRAAQTYVLPLHKIVVSRWLQDTMWKIYGDDDVSVVMNPVDLELFHAPPRGKAECPTIGFLYTRSPTKNVALAIDALDRAYASVPGLRAVAFGAQKPNPDLPLPSWVDFHIRPPQEQLPHIYAACDAWLLTSETEGFGLPILEAMACRTPVLSTAAGAAPELVDGTNGKLLPPDADTFADAISEIASMTEARWRKLSESAYTQAKRHSWSHAVTQFEEALCRAMRKTAARAAAD